MNTLNQQETIDFIKEARRIIHIGLMGGWTPEFYKTALDFHEKTRSFVHEIDQDKPIDNHDRKEIKVKNIKRDQGPIDTTSVKIENKMDEPVKTAPLNQQKRGETISSTVLKLREHGIHGQDKKLRKIAHEIIEGTAKPPWE